MLEVRRNYVKVALPRRASDRMEAQGPGATWRMDRYSPDTTYQRQLKVPREVFARDGPCKCQVFTRAWACVAAHAGCWRQCLARQCLARQCLGASRIMQCCSMQATLTPVLITKQQLLANMYPAELPTFWSLRFAVRLLPGVAPTEGSG